jgi:AraC family transcriptional regulator
MDNADLPNLPSHPCPKHGRLRDVSLRRRTIHRNGTLLIEDSALPFARALGHDYSPNDQFAFPYFGAFTWRVGSFERLVDSNVVLKVRGGEEFFEAHPIAGTGHASIILTPSPAMLDELRASAKRGNNDEAPTVAVMNDRDRLNIRHLLSPAASTLALDEIAIELIAAALRADSGLAQRTSKLVERAKTILHERYLEPISLECIASRLCVSPVYLTQTFRRQEGVPLYRYQTRLRLNRALLMLPVHGSITEVALELGFSSHAHFTAAFKGAFRITPTAYRASKKLF